MESRTIELKDYIPDGTSNIKFLRAEVPIGPYYSPFALIRYELQGEVQKLGLRLDMDKKAFIDPIAHFEGKEHEGVIREAATKIAKLVRSKLYSK